jgi:hypothetical protein
MFFMTEIKASKMTEGLLTGNIKIKVNAAILCSEKCNSELKYFFIYIFIKVCMSYFLSYGFL